MKNAHARAPPTCLSDVTIGFHKMIDTMTKNILQWPSLLLKNTPGSDQSKTETNILHIFKPVFAKIVQISVRRQ